MTNSDTKSRILDACHNDRVRGCHFGRDKTAFKISQDLQGVKRFVIHEQARREDVRVGGGSQSCTVQDSAAVQVQFTVPTCKRVSCYLCSEVLLDNYGMSLDEMLRDRIVCGIAKR